MKYLFLFLVVIATLVSGSPIEEFKAWTENRVTQILMEDGVITDPTSGAGFDRSRAHRAIAFHRRAAKAQSVALANPDIQSQILDQFRRQEDGPRLMAIVDRDA